MNLEDMRQLREYLRKEREEWMKEHRFAHLADDIEQIQSTVKKLSKWIEYFDGVIDTTSRMVNYYDKGK